MMNTVYTAQMCVYLLRNHINKEFQWIAFISFLVIYINGLCNIETS